MASSTQQTLTGVQLMKGIGVQAAKGFWADAWSYVLRRPRAIVALTWIGLVAFFAVFAPLLANGHPFVLRTLDSSGKVLATTSPWLSFLSSLDVLLLAFAIIGLPLAFFLPVGSRVVRFRWLVSLFVITLIIIVIASFIQNAMTGRDPAAWLVAMRGQAWAPFAATAIGFVFTATVLFILPLGVSVPKRLTALILGEVLAFSIVAFAWNRPSLEVFNYHQRELAGTVSATYTVIPFSPSQRYSELSRREPGSALGPSIGLEADAPGYGRRFHLGTDAFGSDVLSQILHACRLSISIGLVSTSIAVLIGVTMGALMGYFGGYVDLFLYRVVEIFMAVPVLFLLIVAAAVLPTELRTTYTMMAIIGCFTWTGMARYTRAEFLKLRNQDFVQAARALGLPLRSILFKHILPNGVAPVLVDTSFAIAAAITIEAVLSYLNLGPIDQPSWGRLLASAVSAEGQFKWWLAVFPGLAIFLTVLAYNIIGEALRDAIDPKLKKARV